VTWVLAIVAVTVLGVAAVSGRLSGTPVTPAMVFVVIGVLVGPLFLDDVTTSPRSSIVRTLAEATLALVLFCDASRIDVRALRPARYTARSSSRATGRGAREKRERERPAIRERAALDSAARAHRSGHGAGRRRAGKRALDPEGGLRGAHARRHRVVRRLINLTRFGGCDSGTGRYI
jgi:hypothetical protein